MKTEQELLNLTKKNGWEWISINQKLSERFIEKYSDKVDWWHISRYQKLSEQFIEKYSNRIYWGWVSIYQKLSEKFIEKYSDGFAWELILINQKLSEQFVEKHSNRIDWEWISKSQELSEQFIEKYSDKVDWGWISKYQKLSEQFIEKYSDKVDWNWISQYQKLSEQFIKKYKLEISKDNWLYATKEEKLKFIKQNTDYEIIDDNHIIAFKSVRSDNCSVFNFQYRYEVGKTYESHCDCNLDNENSFGLAAWTKGAALGYHSRGKLLKVKINVDDIGAIIKNNQKIRCFKLEVLEEIKIGF